MSQPNQSNNQSSTQGPSTQGPSTLFQQMFQDKTSSISPANQSSNNQSGNILEAFRNFRNTFQGDPEAKVKELLASGKMSQQQFDQFANQARYFMNMFSL